LLRIVLFVLAPAPRPVHLCITGMLICLVPVICVLRVWLSMLVPKVDAGHTRTFESTFSTSSATTLQESATIAPFTSHASLEFRCIAVLLFWQSWLCLRFWIPTFHACPLFPEQRQQQPQKLDFHDHAPSPTLRACRASVRLSQPERSPPNLTKPPKIQHPRLKQIE
jgi:hypothetical protein